MTPEERNEVLRGLKNLEPEQRVLVEKAIETAENAVTCDADIVLDAMAEILRDWDDTISLAI